MGLTNTPLAKNGKRTLTVLSSETPRPFDPSVSGPFRVVLVNPRDSQIPIQDYSVYEHLGLAMLAAYLRSVGYTVEIVDGYAENLPHAEVARRVVAFEPQLVGLTCTYQSYPDVLEIAKRLRRELPDVHVTFGGEHATYAAHDVLTTSGVIDSVVRGEGEATLAELADSIRLNRPFSAIAGLNYRFNGDVVVNPDRHAIENLDAMPFASRDTLALSAAANKSVVVGMLGSRGCYSKCNFCNANQFFRLGGGRVVRRRSPQNIADEISELYESQVRALMARGIEARLYFYDATFITRDRVCKQWAREIAEEVISRGVAIPFQAFARADSFADTPEDAALVARLKRAGLRYVFIGFESGTDAVLDAYQKGAAAADNREAVRVLKKYGIFGVTNGFIMFGPYSSIADLRANADFLMHSDQATYWNLSQRMQLFPGVKLIDQLRNEGRLEQVAGSPGIYGYTYSDRLVAKLASILDLNHEPVIGRENTLVRYARHIMNRVRDLGGIDNPTPSAQRLYEQVSGQFSRIQTTNYEAFNGFIDLALAGTLDDRFEDNKRRYLHKLGRELDELEEQFQEFLTAWIDGSDANAQPAAS